MARLMSRNSEVVLCLMGLVFHSLGAHPPLLWLMLIWKFPVRFRAETRRFKSELLVI